jgi:hypothetical protein
MLVEHFPNIVLETIQQNPSTFEWFANEWVVLVVVNPETRELFQYKEKVFKPYERVNKTLQAISNLDKLMESHEENFPVFLLDSQS